MQTSTTFWFVAVHIKLSSDQNWTHDRLKPIHTGNFVVFDFVECYKAVCSCCFDFVVSLDGALSVISSRYALRDPTRCVTRRETPLIESRCIAAYSCHCAMRSNACMRFENFLTTFIEQKYTSIKYTVEVYLISTKQTDHLKTKIAHFRM